MGSSCTDCESLPSDCEPAPGGGGSSAPDDAQVESDGASAEQEAKSSSTSESFYFVEYEELGETLTPSFELPCVSVPMTEG